VVPEYQENVVFDAIEPSPFYNPKEEWDKYISEKDYIIIPRTEYDVKPGTYADIT
jgi:hypothetical protein